MIDNKTKFILSEFITNSISAGLQHNKNYKENVSEKDKKKVRACRQNLRIVV